MDFEGLEKKDKNRIIGGIRQAFKYSDMHKKAKFLRRVEVLEGKYKNGKDKIRVYYQCDECHSLEKDLDIDHIKPVGSFDGSFDSHIKKIWCMDTGGLCNLQGLCKSCHGEKTSRERRERLRVKSEKAELAKRKLKD